MWLTSFYAYQLIEGANHEAIIFIFLGLITLTLSWSILSVSAQSTLAHV